MDWLSMCMALTPSSPLPLLPTHSSGHACVQIGHYMYIIGGYSDGALWLL